MAKPAARMEIAPIGKVKDRVLHTKIVMKTDMYIPENHRAQVLTEAKVKIFDHARPELNFHPFSVRSGSESSDANVVANASSSRMGSESSTLLCLNTWTSHQPTLMQGNGSFGSDRSQAEMQKAILCAFLLGATSFFRPGMNN